MSNINDILSHSDCLTHEQINAYLSNTLDKEQVHDIENHMADCMFCSDTIEGLEMMSVAENEEHIGEIQSDIEKLIFAEEDEESLIATKTEKIAEPTKLKSKKGGKTISWRAAAGVFFLIFAGGLAVFSYINNNTNWMNPNGKDVVKGKSNTKEVDLKESSTNGRELETYSIDAEDLADFKEEKKVAGNNKKNQRETRKDKLAPPTSPVPLVAKNERQRNASAQPAQLPNVSSTVEEKMAAKPKALEDRYTADDLAKADVETKEISNPMNAGASNTYTQPLYEGKMKSVKDINSAPAVSKTSSKLKKSKYRRQESKQLESESDKMIDAMQSQGYGKKGYYEAKDYHSEGVYAFNQAKYKESVKLLKKALRDKNLKDRDETLYYLALAYEKTNNLKKARKIYEQLSKSESYRSRSQSRLKLMPTK